MEILHDRVSQAPPSFVPDGERDSIRSGDHGGVDATRRHAFVPQENGS
ncbi:MAG: hypothetical protein MR450_11225 [Prevotella sp.]|nr:hypothetical protein [Prevotella sp.]MDY4038923.1 hypothetical protein [Prevotella sp.]